MWILHCFSNSVQYVSQKSSWAFTTTKYFSSFSDTDLLFKWNPLRTVEIRQLITKLAQNKSDFTTTSLESWPALGARLMCVIIGAFLSQLCAIKCKTTRFSYNLQGKTLKTTSGWRHPVSQTEVLEVWGGECTGFMLLQDLRLKILFSGEVSGEYIAKGSLPLRRTCSLSTGVFP